MISDWLYMCKEDCLETVLECLKDEYDVEIWKELGVLEVNKDASSLDFEQIPEGRWDDYCREVLKEKSYGCIYQVSLGKAADKWAEAMMKKIVAKVGGQFCADTEDLEPHF